MQLINFNLINIVYFIRGIIMIDINLIRNDAKLVKENIEKKFQHHKLVLVDEILVLDERLKELKQQGDALRAERNKKSLEIGKAMQDKQTDKAETLKKEAKKSNEEIFEIEEEERELNKQIKDKMMLIPNIMASDVPIGKDDSENVELEQFLPQNKRDFDVPHHVDILEKLGGVDLDSARKISGHGFYFLTGDIARLHSAVLCYARDFMVSKGFTYVIPPVMIRGEVVTGVMSFEEMDSMMYKVEGEDLYLVGTSEHSMIGRYINTILDEKNLPLSLTSYSTCFRKEKGAHGIEERGVYRVHQFEKQEMVVICKPEESYEWYKKLYSYTVELFVNMEIPVRLLECCSGDLADLKYKSVDVEAWSVRQQKYFEVGSCSNLTDAQARRLGIRYKTKTGNIYAHTLNNTVVASPRMLVAFLENHVNADGSLNIPKVLQPYLGGLTKIEVKK